ncbi:MAG: hypothetical protein DMG00_09855 [Acidobacteria bacterium]|nr:MAG: hypothetical protein DMG00_09855 [Acidobacteriota bacterium]
MASSPAAANPAIHSSWRTRPGCASEAIPPASWMRPKTCSGGAPARGTKAGRPRASHFSNASLVSATWPEATSARAIQGRPTDLAGSSMPGCRTRSASSWMSNDASRSITCRTRSIRRCRCVARNASSDGEWRSMK